MAWQVDEAGLVLFLQRRRLMDNSHLKMEVLHTDCSSDDKKYGPVLQKKETTLTPILKKNTILIYKYINSFLANKNAVMIDKDFHRIRLNSSQPYTF